MMRGDGGQLSPGTYRQEDVGLTVGHTTLPLGYINR